MELVIPDKKFVCVDFPANVVNIDRAMATLGGIKAVYKTFNDSSMRMKLNFRHEDCFSKATYGDCVARKSLLVKFRRKKSDPTMESLEGEIIGTVDTTYTFTSMCDFQFLAMKSKEDGTFESHLEENIIRQVEPKEWLTRPAQLFIPPPIFSRFDQPVQYCFKNHKVTNNFNFPENCIGISRSRRPHFTMFFKFGDSTVPNVPHQESLNKIEKIALPSWKVDKVKEMFEKQQTIWSTVALHAEVGPIITREDLKHILPSLAYYCSDGPWRAMWVRLGYDMRKDPSSKIYQNLDSRQEKKMSALSSNKIPSRRNTYKYHLPNTIARSMAQPTSSVHMPSGSENVDSDRVADFKQSLESAYIFRPGVTPSFRQIFYHLCNIDEPEVQKLVHLNDGKETECTEKDGWCLPDTIEKCRSIINSYRNKKTGDFGCAPQDEADEYDEEFEEEEEDEEMEDFLAAHEAPLENLLDQANINKIMDLLPK